MHKIFTSSRPQVHQTYGMSITGVRPANVTGPDKGPGSVDHVQIMTDAARGKPVHLPKKGLMRLLIHVEDIAEVFTRVLLPTPRATRLQLGGSREFASWRTSCAGSSPTRRSTFGRRAVPRSPATIS